MMLDACMPGGVNVSLKNSDFILGSTERERG